MSSAGAPDRGRPLIAHVVYRFDVGGMENGIVNLLNRLPRAWADHCVVALTEVSAQFAGRVERPDVRFVALRKPPGPMLAFLPTLWRTFRSLAPDLVHTRNVGTLEAQLSAWAAGVPVRIHGEHGWDVGDLKGENRRMLRLRRMVRPFVHRQIALSAPTHRYLRERVGVPEARITNICNGVDTARFSPAADRQSARSTLCAGSSGTAGVLIPDAFVVGAVGRIAAVKNLPALIEAFAAIRNRNPAFAERGRLAIVGDGPARDEVSSLVHRLAIDHVTWMAGSRADVADCIRAFDLVCLPSLAEGISNAILESMACGVPVVATDVGGNSELVHDGVTGTLVRCGDVTALSRAIEAYFTDEAMFRRSSAEARSRAVTQFSLDAMVGQYHGVYCAELARAGWPRTGRLGANHTTSNV